MKPKSPRVSVSRVAAGKPIMPLEGDQPRGPGHQERAVRQPVAGNVTSNLPGLAQSGSASALGAEGRWFKSSNPDQSLRLLGYARVLVDLSCLVVWHPPYKPSPISTGGQTNQQDRPSCWGNTLAKTPSCKAVARGRLQSLPCFFFAQS